VLGVKDAPEIVIYRPHAAAERRLEEAGVSATLLRPDAFQSNLMLQLPAMAQGMLAYPAEDSRLAHVHPADIAEAAVGALTSDAPPVGPVELPGPEALTYGEVAARISERSGHAVSYAHVPPEGWREALLQNGMPEFYADALVELFEHYRSRTDVQTDGSNRRIDVLIDEQIAPALREAAA
jgi:uncharacterized protein YbjT (DUF2867 family)